MLFSIIVTIYNVEQYLEKCIDSILTQSYENFELILIDDGSTDGSGNICDHYAKMDRRIVVIHKTNGGLISARTTGIELARGQYTVYVDGDDWIEQEELMEIYEVVKNNNVDLVEFGFYKEYEGLSEERHAGLTEGLYNSAHLWEKIEQLLKDKPCFVRALEGTICCKAVNTEILKRVERNMFHEITWGEDAIATFGLLHEINSFYVTYKPLYHYRVHSNSMMHKQKTSQIELVEKQLYKIWNMYKKEESKDYLKYLLNYLVVLEQPQFAVEKYLTKIIEPNAKTVIYGKGVFAKQIIEAFTKNKKANIVDVVDFSDVERIRELDYDVIFIAITITSIVEKSVDTLMKIGVKREQIKFLENNQLVWPKKG